MASVTPGYTFWGAADPITYTKLNLLGQPTVVIGADEVTSDNLASGLTINNLTVTAGLTVSTGGLTIAAGTPIIGAANSETFAATITITDGDTKANTRLINCSGSTAATINATGIPQAGTQLIISFLTDSTASNTITFNTGFKATGTYALNSANKYYQIMFVSDGTYYREVCRSGGAG